MAKAMSDRKNLISDFEHAVRKADAEGWDFVDLTTEDGFEILDMLKAQEPRVLTLEEVLSSPDTMIWVDEIWNDENSAEQYALIENFTYENCYVILRFFDGSSSEESTHYYNEKWRCWSARPTDEQREAIPWTE